MKNSLLWLREVEAKAAVVYDKAAAAFSHDQELSELLLNLSRDELSHKKALERALEDTNFCAAPDPAIAFDNKTKEEILRPFIEFRNRLSDGRLSKEELLGSIMDIEFSEMNHIFLYMVNCSEGQPAGEPTLASEMEGHKDRILEYLATLPDGAELLKRADRLPKPHKKKILVVDDMKPNAALLKAILDDEGVVFTALSGHAALAELETRRIEAVITDVDMPEMSGIDLYRKAVERHPELKDRFIFYTCGDDSERLSFIRENRLPYLLKPATISGIRSTVRSILHAR